MINLFRKKKTIIEEQPKRKILKWRLHYRDNRTMTKSYIDFWNSDFSQLLDKEWEIKTSDKLSYIDTEIIYK